MENVNKKPLCKLLILMLSAVLAVTGLVGCGGGAEETDPSQIPAGSVAGEPAEEPAVALPTRYIVLSYPAEIKEDVKISYEDLEDGQKITFITHFTGEELELFHFIISKSEAEGYLLGVLEDEQAGSLNVYVNVHEYSQGNWEVGDYTKLNALQERVNDIITQFYEDSRFVPNRS